MALSVSLAGAAMQEVVIVGAGVAGLSCMNALLDLGIKPLLIEAGTIGTNKLCGEFISQKAALQLKKWNIGPIQNIQDITLRSKNAHLTLELPAGAMSRSAAELQLAERAKALGGQILEHTKIEKLLANQLVLIDGSSIYPKQLIIATGRFGSAPKQLPYMGLKAHFLHDTNTARLEMQLFKGGYFGMLPISPTTSNITCLVKATCYNQAFIEMNKDLPWLTSPVGSFGLKNVPHLPNTYWIGDAIASLPPAIGQGFGHAIHSATLAATYLLKNDPEGYRRQIIAQLKPKMRRALLVHHAMLSPTASHLALNMLQKFPKPLAHFLHSIGL